MPDPAPAPVRRRLTILLLMAVVAAAALPLGVVKYRRDAAARQARLALLRSDLARASDRAQWSERMQKQGYVSAAQAIVDRMGMERAKAELKAFEGR